VALPTVAAFYGLSEQQIAQWAGVTLRTAHLYRTGRRKPSLQALRLVTLYREERVLQGPWKRWVVRGNKLVTPEGLELPEAVLRGYREMLSWARSVAGSHGLSSEYWARLERIAEAEAKG
jgi:hypothetical protein